MGDVAARAVTLVVVDDDPIVRQALSGVLARVPGIVPVAALADGQEAVEHARRGPADVYLLDVAMPVMDGLSTVITMRSMDVRSRLVLLTSLTAEPMAAAATRAGADAFLLKTTPVGRIAAAVLGRPGSPPSASNGDAGRAAVRGEADDLSTRELEVLELLCAACSNAEIAARLSLAESTVKAHVGSVMSKLGVDSRLKAVVKALRTGLVRD